jgi:hypothetical protein
LQRAIQDDALSGVLGLIWGAAMGALALGPSPHRCLVGSWERARPLPRRRTAAGADRRRLPPHEGTRRRGGAEQAAALVDGVPMFRARCRSLRRSGLPRSSFARGPRGATIVRAGDVGDRFYLVDSGAVRIGLERREAERPGDYFGEIALMRDVPRTAAVTPRQRRACSRSSGPTSSRRTSPATHSPRLLRTTSSTPRLAGGELPGSASTPKTGDRSRRRVLRDRRRRVLGAVLCLTGLVMDRTGNQPDPGIVDDRQHVLGPSAGAVCFVAGLVCSAGRGGSRAQTRKLHGFATNPPPSVSTPLIASDGAARGSRCARRPRATSRSNVEAHVRDGIPGSSRSSGLRRPCLPGSRERVRSGISAAELNFPAGADHRKPRSRGAAQGGLRLRPADRARAPRGVAASFRAVRSSDLRRSASSRLDGRLRRGRGVLAVARARALGAERTLCPGRLGSRGVARRRRRDPDPATSPRPSPYLRGERELKPEPPFAPERDGPGGGARPRDVRGQERAGARSTLAAGSGHNCFRSPARPGRGKTMLARRLPGILPPLDSDAALEVTRIHSVAGSVDGDHPGSSRVRRSARRITAPRRRPSSAAARTSARRGEPRAIAASCSSTSCRVPAARARGAAPAARGRARRRSRARRGPRRLPGSAFISSRPMTLCPLRSVAATLRRSAAVRRNGSRAYRDKLLPRAPRPLRPRPRHAARPR